MQISEISQKRSLVLNIRGENYKAQRLTKTNYLALGSLVRDKGKMPDLEAPGAKVELAEQMLVKFADPDFLKRLCYSLLAIFPTLVNNHLVWFQPEGGVTPPWGTTLEPEEILEIITAVAGALQDETAREKSVEILYREQLNLDKIAELERAIAELKTQEPS